ncbi:uncharacterized protein LOC142617346 isoform X2 [Castanea sativa]|uniref:uncharacterized protein LOC142617346 isoform X2 n=1 Tax=Castanea sativa TaxID=21020 RepID=UPI003F654024
MRIVQPVYKLKTTKKKKKKGANYKHLRTTNSRHTSTSSDQKISCLNISVFSKMDERMTQAAESGDINALPQLIEEDVNVLDHIDQVPFIQTPLHVAASAGHIQFATKMMILKPSFAHKLNPNRLSPIHLALQNGHIELVRQLLELDGDLVRVKGKECITPLHYVAATERHETALHIALKNEQFEAFKFLVGWLGRNFFKNASLNVKSVLDQKNDEGNTVLHITVSKDKTQIVSHLLAWGFQFVDVNRTNLEGKTAWDILQGQTQVNSREIGLMLHSAGALSGVSLSSNAQSDDNNIDEFYNLIGEDVQLLEHIDELPFVNTPLHIAASYGNIQFALEMMTLKPSFARKQNQNGFSPIHLALRNKYTKLVVWLLQIDGDLLRVKGRERLTLLHYVVESGESLHLLEEFLSICPDSITDVTVRNETTLHIALKYNRLEAFQFLVGWLANNSSEFNQRKVLNWQDNEGNNVLHILVSENQTQVVRHFLSWANRFIESRFVNFMETTFMAMGVNRGRMRFVDVNQKNLEDKTAWDISREDNREIRDMLRRAGAKPGSSLSTSNRYPNPEYQRLLTVSYVDAFLLKNLRREMRKFTVEWRNILLVVAALLVTLSFQAVLTPPGGLWQDNGQCQPFNQSVGSSNFPKIIYPNQSNTTLVCEHKAGTAIAFKDGLFLWLFLIPNTALFLVSTFLTVHLIVDIHTKSLFTALNIILFASYFYSVSTITDTALPMIFYSFFAYFVYILLLD